MLLPFIRVSHICLELITSCSVVFVLFCFVFFMLANLSKHNDVADLNGRYDDERWGGGIK